MHIPGHWLEADDGETRPVLRARVGPPGENHLVLCPFLVDTGADHTVLSAEVTLAAGLPTRPSARRIGGVGGVVEMVEVFVRLGFRTIDDAWVSVEVECFAFAADGATDMPILGRDVLDLFALVVDKPGDVVCLVRDRHRYVIQES